MFEEKKAWMWDDVKENEAKNFEYFNIDDTQMVDEENASRPQAENEEVQAKSPVSH